MILILLLLAACTTNKVYYRGPLSEQILVFREGYTGLTNGTCELWEKEDCKQFVVKSYDLDDKSIRDQLRELQFVCKLGDKRFTICADRAGLCHKYYKGSIFKKEVVEFIAQTEVQRLLNGGTVCFNEDEYPYLEM